MATCSVKETRKELLVSGEREMSFVKGDNKVDLHLGEDGTNKESGNKGYDNISQIVVAESVRNVLLEVRRKKVCIILDLIHLFFSCL